MTALNVQIPTANQPNATEDPKITTSLTNLNTWANGNIDASNLSAAAAQAAGMNQAGQTVKGAVSIATSQSTSSATYTTLTTPDQVAGLTLPTNGVIAVWYQATWQESVSGAGRAALFIGANQLKVDNGSANPVTQAAATNTGTAATNTLLSTSAQGLVSGVPGTGYAGDVTTGQLIGNRGATAEELNGVVNTVTSSPGPIWLKAAAGSYSVAIQFKASSGTVTATNRYLAVFAFSFA